MRGRGAYRGKSSRAWIIPATVLAAAWVLRLWSPAAVFAQSAPHATKSATRAFVSSDATTTEFALDLTAGVTAEVFTLADPYRVVIELPDLAFELPPGTGSKATGLIAAFRYGAFADNRSRVVIDTAGPVEIAQAVMVNRTPTANSAGSIQLRVQLKLADAAVFGKGTGAARAGSEAYTPKPTVFDDNVAPAPARLKPIIMIDPGHGGIDPGAIGSGKTLEKNIVLAVALQLKSALEATGHYEVRLTRSADIFIALDKRVELSHQANADIFLSLHADTIEDRHLAQSIHGASIYTLSDKASNEEARLMAEKENAADLAAGIEPSAANHTDDVKPILFDLLARETAAYSHLLSRSLVSALSRHHPLAHEPERAAAFRVLRQAHSPSVLIELGFLSNTTEEHLMSQPAWQKQVAGAISTAVDTYFVRKETNTANAPGAISYGGLPP